jgi:hypothetical protein
MRNGNLFLIIGIVFLINLGLASALISREVYFDGFESNNLAGNWTANAKYTISTAIVYAGTYSVIADGGTADVLMTITNGQNISNQTTCNLTVAMQIHTNFDGGEYLCLDYSTDGGTTWNLNTGSDGAVGGLCQDGNVDTEGAWRNVSYYFTPSGTGLFKFRFRQNSNNANEDGYIDNVNLTCTSNVAPTINNITASHATIKGGDTITIYANTSNHGVNDSEADTLYLYCDTTNVPTAANTDCTGGTTSDSTYPYILTCTFATAQTSTSYTEFCRIYDGTSYSSVVPNITYTTDSTIPTTSITSVAGDTAASYFDNVNDGRTEIIVSGESSMVCRWSASDVSYSSMSNTCSISGTSANCSINDAVLQELTTRYVSCADSLGNEQNSSNNLNVQFYLDYTAPTTTDNSVAIVQLPGYNVIISEADNVDSDPTTYYCSSAIGGCNPTTSIDNGGVITYTTSNRGVNYLRYYSIDDAGNSQVVVNKTININYLPVFVSASDDATTIKGGTTVNVSTNSYDQNPGQERILYVCSSLGANYSGCNGTQYCTSSGTTNLSCTFSSETDSSSHNWYAYIYDESNEAASANPLTGGYTTDYTNPIVTLINPSNASTLTQNSVTITITSNEALTNAWYSLDSGASNITMSNISLLIYTHSNMSLANRNYNLSIWANDSYGNIGSLLGNYFNIDSTAGDTTAPLITILSPINETYYTSSSIFLNITTDEALSWAGYSNNSNTIYNLDNVSTTNWNKTMTFSEGQHNITFYANDSSSNKNQANKSISMYIDLTNPQVVTFSCTDANDSQDVNCSYSVSDNLGLDHLIIGYNATGSFQNSSQISLSGTSATGSYIIGAGNTSVGKFTAQIYLYDLSGRTNFTSSDEVTILDDLYPKIYNITYFPNATDALDPDIAVNVNATIVEDYSIGIVSLMYKNSSDSSWTTITMTNQTTKSANTSIIYNASFTPANGTYIFKINATDAAGNQNISSNYTLVIANETSFWNYTEITLIKSFTYAQRSSNNTIGNLYLNNTGENLLNLNVTIVSSISGRFNINYTNDDNVSYVLAVKNNLTLVILANTTGLASGLYYYNISIASEAGATIYEKQLNIQTADGPYLITTISTYSSSVTSGQTGVELVSTVQNLGTQDATGVSLDWTLPSEFIMDTGNLTRNLGNLPIGLSGTNSITISVSSSAADKYVNISTSATSTNANSSSEIKQISIGSPVTITETTASASGGGGGGGGSAAVVKISKTIEITRGAEDSFEIEVENKYGNSTLENLILDIAGYPSQYITITPKKIDLINKGEKGKFKIKIKIPKYQGYENILLNATITGQIIQGNSKQSYTEKQYILLTAEEIPFEEANLSLIKAEKAIEDMKAKGFYSKELEKILANAKNKLDQNKNKEAFDLSEEIIKTKEQAFNVDNLINRIKEAILNPKKTNLLTGNAITNLDDNYPPTQKDFITGKAIFSSKSSSEMLDLAIAAFSRGDYKTAEERAKTAQILLLLERKGNLWVFLYLYWPLIFVVLIILFVCLIIGYRIYKRKSINSRIVDLNKKEETIEKLVIGNQEKYYSGKISAMDYNLYLNKNQKDLSDLKEERIKLRNIRGKILSTEQLEPNLNKEKAEIENEIKEIQKKFYKEKKITEQEYKLRFEELNKTLAEIEEERITNLMLNKIKKTGKSEIEEKKEKLSLGGWLKNLFKTSKPENKGIVMMDSKVISLLKEHTKGKDLNGRWIVLNKGNKK